MSTSLARITEARNALVAARTLDDVLDIRDKAEAIRIYQKAIGESLEAQNAAAEIKLRAERKAGEMLAGMERIGSRPKKGSTAEPFSVQLEEMGIAKTQAHRWQREATIPDEQFEAHVRQCNDSGNELTQASVLKLAGAGHVSQSTGENEWYTPAEFIEISRGVMGDIDLDPASSDLAQVVVRAKKYFTIADDGLSKKWRGRVWMNPPYSKDLISKFAGKLLTHVESGEVEQAIVLVNNATETAWFQPLARASSAICFPSGRIRFTDKFGKPANSPLQGQTLLYFGAFSTRFCDAFCNIGVVFTASSTGAVIDAA